MTAADGTSRKSRPRILVIGDVMSDVIVRPEGPLVPGADRRAAIRVLPGGSAANQSAWLAFAGAAPILLARVGRDDHARHVEALRAAGIEPVLAADDELPSGMLVSLVSPDGERSFLTDRGANDRLSRGDLPDSLLEQTDFVHVSGYALTHPQARAAVLDFVGEAVRRGIGASVDPGSVSLLQEVGAAAFLNWTRFAALCVPNAAEAAALAGSDDPERQLEALRQHYATVVIKRGASGAVARGAGDAERCVVPSPAVEVLDTTGAGDAFLAGFLSCWLAGASLVESLRSGCALGAMATTMFGGRPPRWP